MRERGELPSRPTMDSRGASAPAAAWAQGFDAATAAADPLFALLRRLRLTPTRTAAALCLGVGIPLFLYASIAGYVRTSGEVIGLLDDFYALIPTLVVVPLAMATFRALPDWITEVVESIGERSAIAQTSLDVTASERDQSSYVSHVQRVRQALGHRAWWVAVALGVAVFQLIVMVPRHMRFRSVWASSWLMLAFTECANYVATYASFMTLIRMLTFTWWLWRLFAGWEVNVWFLHPDGCGGLSAIGSYVARTGLILGLWGFDLAIIVVSGAGPIAGQTGGLYFGPVSVVPLSIYAFAAPIAFMAPMWTAHLAMVKARDRHLLRVAELFQSSLAEVSRAQHSQGSQLTASIGLLAELGALRTTISKAPVWPIQLNTAMTFFSRAFVPLLFSVVPLLIERLLWSGR